MNEEVSKVSIWKKKSQIKGNKKETIELPLQEFVSLQLLVSWAVHSTCPTSPSTAQCSKCVLT